MECDPNIKSCKYIALDAHIANFIDFNGWPREVMILKVNGLEKVFGTDCLLFDVSTDLSIFDFYRILEERHLNYKEV